MDGQFCFMCGAATVAQASRAVPICADCRARQNSIGGESSEWMVERPGARARGPMTRDAVLHGLSRDRIDLDDLIARLGSTGVPISEHPEFRGCFIPGSPDERRISDLRRDNQEGVSRARRRYWLVRLGAAAVLCGALGVLYVGVSTRVFILSGDTLDELEDGLDDVTEAVQGTPLPSRPPETLPHDEWLAKATATVVASEDHWSVDLQQGRMLLWAGDVRSVEKSREAFLQVLRVNPADPQAIGGLAEATVAARGKDPAWLDMATRAVARINAVAEDSLVAKRAGAALAIAEGNDTLGLQLTESCAGEDLGCRLLRAEAGGDLQTLTGLGGMYPDSVRIQLALGRVAQAKGEIIRVEAIAGGITDHWPDEGAAWAMLAEAYAATGRWKRARAAADRAVELDPWRVKARHLSAAVQLWRGGRVPATLEAYTALLATPALKDYSSVVAAWVQGGIAALRADELVLARTWVDAALAEADDHVGAKLLSAAVHLRGGDSTAAKAVLRGVDHALLDGPEGARMHYWAGVLFLDMGQQRLARNELDAAISADPYWGSPRLELAWAKLDSGDGGGASMAIRELGWVDPRLGRQQDLRQRVDLGPSQVRTWRRRLEDAMYADVRLSLKREGTLAVLDWYTGRDKGSATLKRLIDEGEPDLNLQAALSQALLSSGDWAGSLKVTDRVLGSRRKAGLFHAVRGMACHRLGRRAESAGSFDLALKYAGDHPSVLWWVFKARQDNGDADGARVVLEALKKQGIDLPSVAGLELALDDGGE